MAASLRLILTRSGLPDKPEAPIRIVDGRPTGPTPCPDPRHVEFSLIETRLSCEFEPTHTPLRGRSDGRPPQFRNEPQDEQGLGRASQRQPDRYDRQALVAATARRPGAGRPKGSMSADSLADGLRPLP